MVSERITSKQKILRRSGEGVKGRCLPWSKEEEGAYIFWMKQVPVYHLHKYLVDFLHEGWFPNRLTWKSIVKNAVSTGENDRWFILYTVSLCFHTVSLNTKTVTISNIWLFPKNGFGLRLSFFIAKLITTNCDSSLQETYSVLFVGKRTESLRTSSHNYDRIESHN